MQPHTVSRVQLLSTVQEKGEQPDRYPLPYGLNISKQKPQVWELSGLCSGNLNKIVCSWLWLQYTVPGTVRGGEFNKDDEERDGGETYLVIARCFQQIFTKKITFLAISFLNYQTDIEKEV